MTGQLLKVLVIEPSGVQRIERIEPQLEPLQKLVGGDVELIHLPTQRLNVYFNEEGIRLNLAENPVATRWLREELRREGRLLLTHAGWMLGPLVIAGCGEDADDRDVPFDSVPPYGRVS